MTDTPPTQEVATLDGASRALSALVSDLDTAASPSDYATIDKKAGVLRHMASVAKLGAQWANKFTAVQLTSMRKIGDVLAAMPKATGGRPPSEPKPLTDAEGFEPATLAELGFSYNYAAQCQKIAAAAEAVFQEYLKQGEVENEDHEVPVLSKSGLLARIMLDEIERETLLDDTQTPPTEGTHSTEADRRKPQQAGSTKPRRKTTVQTQTTPTPPTDVVELVARITGILDGLEPITNGISHEWKMPGLRVVAADREVDVFDNAATAAKAEAISGVCATLDFSYNETRQDLDYDDFPEEIRARRKAYGEASGALLPDEGDGHIGHWLAGREPVDDAERATFAALDDLGPELAGGIQRMIYDVNATHLGMVISAVSFDGEDLDIADVMVEHMFGGVCDCLSTLHDAYYEALDEIEKQKARIAELEGQYNDNAVDALREDLVEAMTRIAELEGQSDNQ